MLLDPNCHVEGSPTEPICYTSFLTVNNLSLYNLPNVDYLGLQNSEQEHDITSLSVFFFPEGIVQVDTNHPCFTIFFFFDVFCQYIFVISHYVNKL